MVGGFFIADCISNNQHKNNYFDIEKISLIDNKQNECSYTKYTILTIATMDWLMHHRHSSLELIKVFKKYCASGTWVNASK